MRVQSIVAAFALAVLCSTSSFAVELRMKYEKDRVHPHQVDVRLNGEIKVEGGLRLDGKTTANGAVLMSEKVVEPGADGSASIEWKLDGFSVHAETEYNMGEGAEEIVLDLSEKEGKITRDGKEEAIPPMEDIQAKTWKVQTDKLGAPVEMSLDAAGMDAAEAKEVEDLSNQVVGMLSKSAPLPEQNVEVGDTWENILSIEELTGALTRENPMLPPLTELGIKDFKTVSTLKEMKEVAGDQIAVIASNSVFDWNGGNIPLGPVNIQINKLEAKTEALTEMNNTKGYVPRSNTVTTIAFDLTVNMAIGPDGPATYSATGQLTLESTNTVK